MLSTLRHSTLGLPKVRPRRAMVCLGLMLWLGAHPAFAQGPKLVVERVGPPSWWSASSPQELTLLVEGSGLTGVTIKRPRPGIEVVRVEPSGDGSALFVDVRLWAGIEPGRSPRSTPTSRRGSSRSSPTAGPSPAEAPRTSASLPPITWARPGNRPAAMSWRSGAGPTSSPNEDDHALIARIVNRSHPGRGTFLALEGADHGFLKAASPRESMTPSTPGEFNPAVLEACEAWVEKIKVRGDGAS